jgi:uncharacterized protein (UPF0548 family)
LFTWPRPSDEKVRAILEAHADAPFSYAEVGATGDATLPRGYNVDQYRIQLGTGAAAFAAAKSALSRWRMFDASWIRIFPADAAIRQGSVIVVAPAHFGCYSINLCRIVYVVDGASPVASFGFAYGTLMEHAESGEERFTVSWNRGDDSVWYEILAFSRPRSALARIGYPVSRALQKKFGRTSLAAMRTATASLRS